jgi:hypothetical protein
MSEIGKKLKTVLEGYAKFLRDRGLAPPKYQQHLRVCRMIAAPLGALGSLLISPFGGDNHLFSSEQPPQMPGDHHLLLRLGCG